MDKINGISDDELLVKILSFLPTKVAVSTSVLSKQWKFLWMRVPKLVYDDSRIYSKLVQNRVMLSKETKRSNSVLLKKSKRMRDFIDRNLPLHSSLVIESLCLKFLTLPFQPKHIKLWVEIAVFRCVRELNIHFFHSMVERIAFLPNSLYTCKSLVKLKLIEDILVDVPHVVCLPSLKTLHLKRVTYADEESLQRLLSNCHVLEDLIVELCQGDNVKMFSIIIPLLLSLSFTIDSQCCSDGYVIDTPSLKYFKATDFSKSPSCLIVNMPELKEARISTARHNIKKVLEPVTSVKRLSLRIINTRAEVVYGDEIVFNELENLKFFTQMTYWSKLLFWLLNASPKLRTLRFYEYELYGRDTMVLWKQLTSVPQCLLSTLQIFKSSGENVSVEGKDLATYILRKSCRLKTARISIGPGLDPKKKLQLETEVKLSSRGSPTCNLIFS